MHWKHPFLSMTSKGSLEDRLRCAYTIDVQHHRRGTPDQNIIHAMLQKNLYFRGLSLLFSCKPQATLNWTLFFSMVA